MRTHEILIPNSSTHKILITLYSYIHSNFCQYSYVVAIWNIILHKSVYEYFELVQNKYCHHSSMKYLFLCNVSMTHDELYITVQWILLQTPWQLVDKKKFEDK